MRRRSSLAGTDRSEAQDHLGVEKLAEQFPEHEAVYSFLTVAGGMLDS